MRVLQLGSTDLKGKRFNGQYLVENFHRVGVEARHLVWQKEGENPNTYKMLRGFVPRVAQRLTAFVEDRVSLRGFLHPQTFSLLKDTHFQWSQVVHYHLLHWPNYFNLWALPRMTKNRPSVWTVHDYWAMTGHCVHPFTCERWVSGCGECPFPKSDFSMRRDHSHLMWKWKQRIYRQSQFKMIVTSKYMEEKLKRSPLLNQFEIFHVPFGVDLSVFKPSANVNSKRALGIDDDEIVIAFRAAQGDFKGFSYILEALREVRLNGKKVCLLSFNDEHKLEEFKDRFKVIDLGWVDDDELLLNAYNAADFFLMPSMEETFGMMAMEAMAFGKPVVVFSGTSLPEVVGGGNIGIIVNRGSVRGLKEAIEKLIEDEEFRLNRGKAALEFARGQYDLDLHMRRLKSVYEKAQRDFVRT